MFSWPLRIAGWLVGIYALLKLAKATGTVTYTTAFQDLLEKLSSLLGLDLVLGPLKRELILPTLDLIRSFGCTIPPLQDHWQQVFVLTWLVTAAWARNASEGVPTPVALGLAFICTLPFCVAAGTMPVGSAAVAFWPFAGLSAFLAIQVRWRRDWWVALLTAAVSGTSVALGFRVSTGEGTIGIVSLAVGVGLLGLGSLVIGLLVAEGTLWQRLQHPRAAMGLDITAAMLGAFGLATAFADPPLF
jgi:hypothetical protein